MTPTNSPQPWRAMELRLVADALQCCVWVRTDSAAGGWAVGAGAGVVEGRRWPGELARQAREGDELHWYCYPQEAWDMLCGRQGWALVRGGKVIDFTIDLMN